MAGLIKNQLLKHLSKFTKNLSPDKLQLSALKGSCEVNNIELNEAVLTDLLELPLWLSLTRATCNSAAIKIQWMKLKTIPIYLALDEVVVEVETSDRYRRANDKKSNLLSGESTGKYGFIDRVFDGMTITINTVIIRFKSKVFTASLELNRLMVESRSPAWKRNVDLRMTKIKDTSRGQILIFKHIEWQSFRLEAKAEAVGVVQTPLRLITNQAMCRITLKKRLADCAFLGARIVFIFDDLLWVLTDAQLLSALHFADYLGDLIKNAPRNKTFSDESPKPGSQNNSPGSYLSASSQYQKQAMNAQSAKTNQVSQLFDRHDVVETSHHVYVSRIEVHLCDELDPSNRRSSLPALAKGGALQISVLKLVIDSYPYQKAIGSRKHWLRYSDPSTSRCQWNDQHLQMFVDGQLKAKADSATSSQLRLQGQTILNEMRSSVVLVRFSDYSLSCVSTNTTSRQQLSQKLVAPDKTAFTLPDDVVAFYMEINYFYYFDDSLPTPNPNAFLHVAPLKVVFDPVTLIWINAFQANLQTAMLKLQEMMPKPEKDSLVHTRIECLMPVLSFNCDDECKYSSFEIKCGRLVVTNSMTDPSHSKELNTLMDKMDKAFFYERESYPWMYGDCKPISDEFIESLGGTQRQEASGVWIITCEPFWIEFRRRDTNKCVAFVDPTNVTIWGFVVPDDNRNQQQQQQSADNPDINLLVCINSSIKIQINHLQYVFLMRFLDKISEFSVQINQDTLMIQQTCGVKNIFNSFSLAAVIPSTQVNLILKEELKTTQSVGVSPQQSITNMNSAPSDESISIHSDRIGASSSSALPQTLLPKSRSDSLLTDASVQSVSLMQTIDEQQQKDCRSQPVSQAPSIVSFHNPKPMNSPKKNQSAANNSANPVNNNESLRSVESGFVEYSPLNEDDNKSIRSDMSEDSDQFVMLGLEQPAEDDIFNAKVEAAEEALEGSLAEDLSEADNNSDNIKPSCQSGCEFPVSFDVLQVKLSNLNVVQQSYGFSSSLFLKLSNVNLCEHPKMPFNEFLAFTNQSTKSLDNESPSNNNNTNESSLTVRIDSFNKLNKDDLISVVVNDLTANLRMDTVLALNDFITDNEAVQVPMTNLLLEKVKLTLIDEEVSTPPLTVELPRCRVERSRDNHVTIEPLVSDDLKSATVELLAHHLTLIRRNADDKPTSDYRLPVVAGHRSIVPGVGGDDVVDQVIRENEKLVGELERLRQENDDLRTKLEQRLATN